MAKWWCDNLNCGNIYDSKDVYHCKDQSCECQNDLGRSFCSKKCHDEVLL